MHGIANELGDHGLGLECGFDFLDKHVGQQGCDRFFKVEQGVTCGLADTLLGSTFVGGGLLLGLGNEQSGLALGCFDIFLCLGFRLTDDFGCFGLGLLDSIGVDLFQKLLQILCHKIPFMF